MKARSLPLALLALVLILGLEPPRSHGAPSAEAAPRPAVLSVTFRGDQVSLEARSGDLRRTAGPFSKSWFLGKFARLYTYLETQPRQEPAFRALVDELSRAVLAPLAPALASTSEVIILIPTNRLRLPLDLLEVGGRPLFLACPVSYRFGAVDEAPLRAARSWSAFVVSDVTADPQRACRDLRNRFDDVLYHDVGEVSREDVQDADRADVLVLSIHGSIGEEGADDDSMELEDDELVPGDFRGLRPRLAYFDSCQLGVSERFLSAFRAMGTRYYLAPIISNEAGNSSTQTMKRFFRHLREGRTPEDALFRTRRELYELYGSDRTLIRLYRAFPFRVYRLN